MNETTEQMALRIAKKYWHALYITWASPIEKQSVPVPVNETELYEFARRFLDEKAEIERRAG